MNTTHSPIDLRTQLVVPLAFEEAMVPGTGGRHRLVHLLPDGAFAAEDGRPGNLEKSRVSQWIVNEKVAQGLVAAFDHKRTPLVIDYEHQSLNTRLNGQPAPAAGWIEELHYLPGKGLYASVEWTETALGFLERREYRFISPVITFDPQSGEVKRLLSAALTNTPAIDGLDAVAATSQETAMNLKKLAVALGLAETAGENEVLAQATALSAQVAGLSAEADKTPDPKAWVPMDVFMGSFAQVAALKQELDELKTRETTSSLEAGIKAALADGRLLKSQEAWARDLAKAAPEALTTYLAMAKPLAALTGMQSGNTPPADGTAVSLSDEEAYVCAQLGLKPEDMKKDTKNGHCQ